MVQNFAGKFIDEAVVGKRVEGVSPTENILSCVVFIVYDIFDNDSPKNGQEVRGRQNYYHSLEHPVRINLLDLLPNGIMIVKIINYNRLIQLIGVKVFHATLPFFNFQ